MKKNGAFILAMLVSLTLVSCGGGGGGGGTDNTSPYDPLPSGYSGNWLSTCYKLGSAYYIDLWTFTATKATLAYFEYNDPSCTVEVFGNENDYDIDFTDIDFETPSGPVAKIVNLHYEDSFGTARRLRQLFYLKNSTTLHLGDWNTFDGQDFIDVDLNVPYAKQ